MSPFTPNLGWISPLQRTQQQGDAHAAASTGHIRFSLPVPTLAKGQAVRLFDLWKAPAVVADVGFVFSRFHQLTGSCVNVGGANAAFSTIAAQRVASDAPTKAFLPFTWHNYGLSRHYMGDDGQGDGSMGSTFAKSMREDGIRDYQPGVDGMPRYTDTDGITITSSDEYRWSSYRCPDAAKILPVAKDHLFGATAEAMSVQDIKALVMNGYGVAFACNNFIGNGSIRGTGADAYVRGRWDSGGGHQQSVHAVWEHPNDGPLYWAQNSWPGSVYPRDPAGGPVCGVWVAEADVTAAMRLDSEVYGYSHLNWFPAQVDKLLDWIP